MNEREAAVFVEGLGFTEGPRWRDGKLWFSDFVSRKVYALDMRGVMVEVAEVPKVPSGLGWLPDGRLLVVSMEDRTVLRLDGGELVVHADLSALAPFHCNDMVVDAFGRAYVGNFGFDFAGGAKARATVLVLVLPDGTSQVVADGLMFPNGMVISPDGRRLIVGETFASRLTAFDVVPGGGLVNPRVFAQLGAEGSRRGPVPDGICLDAEGAVWVASPSTNECLRVVEGGEVTDRVPTGEDGAFACMLGGGDRRTLFICAGKMDQPVGKILMAQVDSPGAGLP
jgi:sugar lactone lactonase YvrE